MSALAELSEEASNSALAEPIEGTPSSALAELAENAPNSALAEAAEDAPEVESAAAAPVAVAQAEADRAVDIGLLPAGTAGPTETCSNGLTDAGEVVPTSTGNISATQAGDVKPARRSHWWLSWRRLVLLAAIVLGIRTFIGEASVVPTASMEGTILVGDHLFMDKLLYGPKIPLVHWRLPMLKTIRRGDIVIFRYPKNPSETYLKRVAAVGGDRLEIRDGVLYVNSVPVSEPYAVHHAPVHSPLESWGPTLVLPGHLFVMGDNRDNSSDSRDWGFVPVKNVIGEPLFVYWSYDAPTARWLDENPAHRISFYASIFGNFFSHTRWNRTGMLL